RAAGGGRAAAAAAAGRRPVSAELRGARRQRLLWHAVTVRRTAERADCVVAGREGGGSRQAPVGHDQASLLGPDVRVAGAQPRRHPGQSGERGGAEAMIRRSVLIGLLALLVFPGSAAAARTAYRFYAGAGSAD